MAILCKDLNLLYIQVPATGCSVVGEVLRMQCNGEDIGQKHTDVSGLLAQGVLSKRDLQRYLIVANIRNPFDRLVTYYQRLNGSWIDAYFAFKQRDLERRRQRGLFDGDAFHKEKQRIRREEIYKRRRARIIRSIGFNSWVTGSILRWRLRDHTSAIDGPHCYLNHLFPMLTQVHVVLRQEQLEDGLNAILQRQGAMKPVSIPRKNQTPGKKAYAAYYTPFSRRLIEHLYAADLNLLGYTFDGYNAEAPLLYLYPDLDLPSFRRAVGGELVGVGRASV